MYVGLDVGTSGTKASLISADGSIIDQYQVNYNFCSTEKQYRELDANEVWQAVKVCLHRIGMGREIRTITVSSLGEAIIPIDLAGEPLCNSITGTDIRGTDELEEIKASFGEYELTNITGVNLSNIYSVNKILWLKKYRQDIYEKCWKIVTFQDFIVYKLSNETVIDYSMASRTMLFNIELENWSDKLLRATGIEISKLSTPKRGGSIVGMITGKIARELELSTTIKIVAGTHDHICNAIGSGVFSKGSCANTVGTTEGLTAIHEKWQLKTESIMKFQISCEPFVIPGLFNSVAWNNTSGALLKWFVQEFDKGKKVKDIVSTYDKLNSDMEEQPTRLLVLPHFSGAATPYMDSASKGAILGLSLDTSRADIYKAFMESANFELALIMDCLKNAGLEVTQMIVTGGALSKQLLQIKADVLGMQICTVKNKQTGTLGGAILGAVAVGEYKNISEAVGKMVKMDITFEPDKERSMYYQDRLSLYKEIYPAISKINHRI